MTDDSLAVLKRLGSAEAWNAWRRDHPDHQPEFTRKTLYGLFCDLEIPFAVKGARAGLRGIDLRGANLRSAFLEFADLTGADFTDADLEGAVLTDAILDGARIDGANLRDVNLRRASMRNSSLQRAPPWHDSRRGLDGLRIEPSLRVRDEDREPGLIRACRSETSFNSPCSFLSAAYATQQAVQNDRRGLMSSCASMKPRLKSCCRFWKMEAHRSSLWRANCALELRPKREFM